MAESKFLRNVPCDACGSSDAGAIYEDGTFKCHKCGVRGAADDDTRSVVATEEAKAMSVGLATYSIPDDGLSARNLDHRTLRIWNYGTNDGMGCQVANFFSKDGSKIVAQKLRFRDKTFRWKGDHSDVGLYGSWLWDGGGRMVTITEGELDALSVSRAQGNRFAVASLPDGAGSVEKAFARDLAWLESFDRVVLLFDQDEAGRAAAVKGARMLTPGKAFIGRLPEKDANDVLVKHADWREIIKSALWSAPQWRPEGTLRGDEVWQRVTAASQPPFATYPFPGLDLFLGGVRPAETTLLGAGTGAGKSTQARSYVNHWLTEGVPVGIIPLEETVGQFTRRLLKQRVGNPNAEGDELRAEWDAIKDLYTVYEDAGRRDKDSVLDQVKYMALGEKIPIIVLDNLSMLVAGHGLEYVDALMMEIESIVKRTEVSLFVVTHLRKSGEGKAYEQGRVVTLDDFKGSGYIVAVSQNIYAAERNQQDSSQRDRSTLRVLKARETGTTGVACKIAFDPDTGRHHQVDSGGGSGSDDPAKYGMEDF